MTSYSIYGKIFQADVIKGSNLHKVLISVGTTI